MKKLDQIRKKLNELMISSFVIPETNQLYLYHFTTLSSAKSIIKSGQFWISDAFKTNDINEIIHTKEIMKEIIEENVNYQKYQDFILVSFDTICKLISKKLFILCFSLDKNSNKLWKEYAKQGGVCLRFKVEDLTPNVSNELSGQYRLFENKNGNLIKVQILNLNHKICYDRATIKSKIKEYLIFAYKCLELISIDAIENDPDLLNNYRNEIDLLNAIFTDIFLYSCISKEVKWESEVEYRMLYLLPDVHILNKIVHQRTSYDGKKKIDYLKLNLKINNSFVLNRVFVKEKKYLKTVKGELKHVINSEVKIKPI